MSARPSPGGAPRVWVRPSFIPNPWLRWAVILAVAGYLYYAVGAVDMNPARILAGVPRALDFLSRMFPPNFSRTGLLLRGLVESLQMAIFSTFLGVILSLPVAVGAARNVSPRPIYLVSRGYIALSRTFPEVIIAIIFVKAFGFGAFSGMLTLVVASTGFLGKLLAEDIEDIDEGQVEAIRAAGAGGAKILLYAVAPQVLPRLIGLSIYRLDINLRESTIIGIVGAGGIGATLYNSFARYDYDFSLAILLSIIAIVLFAEWASGEIRTRIQ